jgi:polyhydroxyalkanoate synthesis regulator phasin
MTNKTTHTTKRNNTAWIAGLAAGLITGGGVAMVATLPGGAGATTVPSVQQATDDDTASTDSRGTWLADALAPLVEDGTITQAQADAVVTALEDARPDRGGFGGGRGAHIGLGLEAIAEELGLTTDEIRAALEDGQSLADLAAANGSSADALVAVLVDEATTHLDEHVADGDITQEEADERLAEMTERITAMVNGEMPAFDGRGHDGRGPGGRGPGGFGGHHGSAGDDTTGDDTAGDDTTGDESGS